MSNEADKVEITVSMTFVGLEKFKGGDLQDLLYIIANAASGTGQWKCESVTTDGMGVVAKPECGFLWASNEPKGVSKHWPVDHKCVNQGVHHLCRCMCDATYAK